MAEMRHNCNRNGCYQDNHVVKFGDFDPAFSGKRSFSDIDQIAEINGHFLVCEWKEPNRGRLSLGQKIMLQRLSKVEQFTVVVVYGWCATSEIQAIQPVQNGKLGDIIPCTKEEFMQKCSDWEKRVEK